MRFRFALRDLFWMVFLFALALAWWLDHRRLENDLSHYELLMFRAGVNDPGMMLPTIPSPQFAVPSSGTTK
jgi:hypothetical protein